MVAHAEPERFPPAVADFARYFWGGAEARIPLCSVPGFAVMGAGTGTDAEQGRELPAGRIQLYDRFLVFLASGASAGRARTGLPPMTWGEFSALPPPESRRLLEPLLEPHSLVVPTCRLRSVRADSWVGLPVLVAELGDRSLIMGPAVDPGNEPDGAAAKGGAPLRWQPGLLRALRALVTRG